MDRASSQSTRKALVFSVVLTKSAAQTDSGRLKLPRRTAGCHKDVWEGRKEQKSKTGRSVRAGMAPSPGRSTTEAFASRQQLIVPFSQCIITSFNAAVKQRGSVNSHGSQQGVVMEGPFRYCGNIIAVEAAGGWKSKKTHERLCHKRTKADLTASETVVKKVETQTNYAECQHLILKYVQVCWSLTSSSVGYKSYIINVPHVKKKS